MLSPTRCRRTRTLIVAVAGAVVLAACSSQASPPEEERSTSESTSGSTSGSAAEPTAEPSPTEEPEPEPPCVLAAEFDPVEARESADGGSLTAHEAVALGVDCVEEVVLVPAGDPALAAIAVPIAVESGAPLLVGDVDELADLLADLGDPEVRELGPGDGASAIEVAEELDRLRFVAAPDDRPARLAAAARVAVDTDAAVLPVDVEAPAPSLPADAEVTTIGDLSALFPDAPTVEGSWDLEGAADTAWLLDPLDPAAPSTVALAALRGEPVVAVAGGDLLGADTVARVRGAGLDASALVPIGALDRDPVREVVQLVEAPLLPGGSLRLFDGTRMVAVYGHPGSSALGVLGEQDLDATVDRVREVGAGYDADGRTVIPTFEIIASIASSAAEADGSYSRMTPIEKLQPWVDRAAEEGFQVILDLQPGRTDFLTQAQVYEDLLRQPHVGLALDPEWRLEDDQVHLRQIGGVDAAEVQQVVDWLAGLTREEGLTRKLLVLHQFRHSMLRDRDTIEVPPEIAAVVHADGQGSQAVKLDTWRSLTAGAEDRWYWGWKNFYDEDPVVAEPSYVLGLEPEVVLVTFQ